MSMCADLLDTFGDDLMVVNAARESTDKWKGPGQYDDDDRSLIRWLARQDPPHWSPFAHPKAQFRVRLPFFVARQWERHRVGVVRGYELFDMNEMSRRYVDSAPTFYEPQVWRRRPDGSIKQGSGVEMGPRNSQYCTAIYDTVMKACHSNYKELLNLGVAPEMARMVLPVSTMTEWIETGSLLYWARLCQHRIDGHAQQEIQTLARQIDDQMARVWPDSWAALMGRVR